MTMTSVSRPKLLDLCCCAGGASHGYWLAGFDVTGVDINPQPNYPYAFVQADALNFPLDGFDAVHASPPCQRHSRSVSKSNRPNHPDLIAPLRERLIAWGGPWVIENVPGAPLIDPLVLCGTMFADPPTPTVMRHRLFEGNVPLVAPRPCRHELWTPHYPPAWNRKNPLRFVNASGGWGGHTFEERQAAMGIDWMTSTELSEAIPPAYTLWVGAQIMRALEVAA